MSDVAASGGYYIAMPAHAIVAEPATLTGSIGVVMLKFVIDGTLKKIGMNLEGVTNGRFADLYSPVRAFSPEERQKVQQHMQATYDTFVEKAAVRAQHDAGADRRGRAGACVDRQAGEGDWARRRARRARARARDRETAGEPSAGQRSGAGGLPGTEVHLRDREEPVRQLRADRRARRAGRKPRSARAGNADRPAPPVPAGGAARDHAECVREVRRSG